MSKKAKSATATQDERVMAAVAHASIVFSAVGLIGPLVIWGTQREKSAFLAFQALQAAAYQFILVLAGLLAGALYMCNLLAFPVLTLLEVNAERRAAVCLPLLGYSCTFGIFFLLLMLAWLAYIGYGLFGAASVFQGKDLRYVIIGPWLERYLEQA